MEHEVCSRDINYFINNWCYTFDPRRPPKHFPFVQYDYQEKTIDWFSDRLANKENGLLEKSRDMGVTWLAGCFSVQHWLFDQGFTCLFGSEKEVKVDDKTMDSIFGKLRYLLRKLPRFLRPEGFSLDTTDDTYMRLLNPANGNQITGESANPNFGRSGRSSICFLDEFAHMPRTDLVWASITENSDCVIPLSTPNGKGNEFGRLRHETEIPVLSLHWSLHPLKDDDWYQNKKKDRLPWQIAQELDLSYESSKRGKIYKFERQWHIASEIIYCDPELEQWVAWDFGIADPTAILWGQITAEGMVQVYQCFELSDYDIDFHIPISLGLVPKEWPILGDGQKDYLRKVLEKIPMNHNANPYGDRHGNIRTSNSKRSCANAIYAATGKTLKTSNRQTHDWRHKCVDNLLKLRYNHTTRQKYSIVQVSPDCLRFIDCMNNYEWDISNYEKFSDDQIKPLHNQYSHMVTAFEFFTISRFPVVTDTGPSVREARHR